MKNLLLLLVICMSICTKVSSQIVTKEDFESYQLPEFVFDEVDDIDYVKTALAIKELYGLDKNNAITRVMIVDSLNMTKEQIYIEVNNWFTHSFNDGKSVIQLNDKDAGIIIGKGFVRHVSDHLSFTTNSYVHAWVILRIDIKDNKFRITTTIQEYLLDMGAGVLGALNGDVSTQRLEWLPKDFFPFKGKRFKKTTSKAFVNCHIWSLIIADRLAEAVMHGITGAEGDW